MAWLSLVMSTLPVVVFWLLSRRVTLSRRRLAVGVLWGCCVAPLGALVLIGALHIPQTPTGSTSTVPLIEEALKGVVLLFLMSNPPPNRGALVGLFYGAAVGVGFSTVENFFALAAASQQGNGVLWSQQVALRLLLPTLMHVCTSATAGWALGVAQSRDAFQQWIIAPALGYASAVFIHACFNGVVLATQHAPTHPARLTLPFALLGAGVVLFRDARARAEAPQTPS